MGRCAAVLGVSLGALVLGTAAGSAARSDGDRHLAEARAHRPGLVVAEGDPRAPTVSLITLTGRLRRVPAAVRSSPLGLSPDGRLLARTRVRQTDNIGLVELAPVRSGRFKTLLAARCSTCPAGPDPSFAWSPDSSRLAVTVSPERGPTLLRLYDRNGRRLRSFRLPGIDTAQSQPAHQVREVHRLLSWSPDGSRLLLLRQNEYIPTGFVTVDIHSGALRTLASFGHKDEPTSFAWSPNGALLALDENEGWSMHDYTFAVLDVETARPLLQCTSATPCKWGRFGPLAWAPDSRSLFTLVGTSIDRIDLTGHRSTIFNGATPGWIFLAVGGSLVYDHPVYHGDSFVRDTLYLVDIQTRRRRTLYDTKRHAIFAVRPVQLP